MKSFRCTSLFLSLAAASLALADVAEAVTVSPVQLEMVSTGGASRSSLTVINDGAQPLPIEVELKSMTQDENGVRKFSADGQSEFLILPPQALIPPGGSQSFRVQWVGEPLLSHSKSYMLFVNQVPVKLPAGQTAVQLVTSMGAMINVAPPKGTADLKVVATGIETNKKTGQRQPTVTVENPTTVHALLPRSTLRLHGGSWSETVGPDVISGKIGIGLVPPGQRRKFILPVAVPQGVSSIQASIEYLGRR